MSLYHKIIRKLYNLISGRGEEYSYITSASRILEIEFGHANSVRAQQSIDKNNRTIPWFTYPAINYLEQISFKDKTMLEWGAGNSSAFFSPLVEKLYSIEHNEQWFESVKKLNLSNHLIIHAEENAYAAAPQQLNRKFDLILIDGIKRSECSLVSLNLLTEDGLIILDNSDRHPDIAKYYRENNLIQIDFHGFGPINCYTWTTSIFLTRKFMMEPVNRQPQIPIGGGY
jgi:hypothetical protein